MLGVIDYLRDAGKQSRSSSIPPVLIYLSTGNDGLVNAGQPRRTNMYLKSIMTVALVFVALLLPAYAQTYDFNKFVGTYASNATQDFVFVKRLTISKDENGKAKFRATLSGFPDDLPLGESVGEPYAARNIGVYISYLATFSAGKLSVLMVINTNSNSPQNVNITAYMKHSDGSKPSVYFEGNLQKESEKGSK